MCAPPRRSAPHRLPCGCHLASRHQSATLQSPLSCKHGRRGGEAEINREGGGGEAYMEREEEKGTGPQVNFSVSLMSCDVHSMVKRDVQLMVKRNDSPSDIIQSDALSTQSRLTLLV